MNERASKRTNNRPSFGSRRTNFCGLPTKQFSRASHSDRAQEPLTRRPTSYRVQYERGTDLNRNVPRALSCVGIPTRKCPGPHSATSWKLNHTSSARSSAIHRNIPVWWFGGGKQNESLSVHKLLTSAVGNRVKGIPFWVHAPGQTSGD